MVLAAGLGCFTAGCHVKSPLFPQPPFQTEVCSTMGESIRPSSFHNSTLSTNKHIKIAALRYRLLPMALQTVQVRVEPRLSTATYNAETEDERSFSRAVVPQSLAVSAITFPTALSEYIAQGRLQKKSAIQAVLKGRTVAISKKININLVCSSCLKHANEMLVGDPWQLD